MNTEQLKYLDQLLEREVAQGRLYGIAVQVGTREGQTYVSEQGDVTQDSLCMLCSMTKPITSLAAWILIERGIIDPMEPIAKYLPGYANPQVLTANGTEPANREILIEDVMNMTSGIPSTISKDPYYMRASEVVEKSMREAKQRIDAGEQLSNLDILNAMGKAPLFYQPGEKWNYGKNADVLGGIIEAASGVTLDEFFQEEIFKPLQMEDTGFVVPKEKAGRVAKIGMKQEDGKLKEITAQDFYGDQRELWEEPYIQSGGGGAAPVMCRGLYSTLDDYAKLGQMLLAGGSYNGRRILSENTVGLFSINHLTEKQRTYMFPWLKGYGYGSLMRTMVDQGNAYTPVGNGEFGWDGALGTFFSVDREKGIYITYMQQRFADPVVRRKILNIIYSAL